MHQRAPGSRIEPLDRRIHRLGAQPELIEGPGRADGLRPQQPATACDPLAGRHRRRLGIIDGLGKMASHWTTGKTTSLTGISTGGWFGEGSLLKKEARRYDVMAIRETRVAFMNRSTFLWLLDHSIPFNRYMIEQLNERLGQFIGMMENERLLDIDNRIARVLAALFNPVLYPGTNRLLQISQEELGYLAGVSRQRANQGLKVLEDAGLVRSEYGGINVLDLDGLRTFGD